MRVSPAVAYRQKKGSGLEAPSLFRCPTGRTLLLFQETCTFLDSHRHRSWRLRVYKEKDILVNQGIETEQTSSLQQTASSSEYYHLAISSTSSYSSTSTVIMAGFTSSKLALRALAALAAVSGHIANAQSVYAHYMVGPSHLHSTSQDNGELMNHTDRNRHRG